MRKLHKNSTHLLPVVFFFQRHMDLLQLEEELDILVELQAEQRRVEEVELHKLELSLIHI